MACEETPLTADQLLAQAVADPAKAMGDGWSAEQHRLADLLEWHKRESSKSAAGGTRRGLVITRLQPPGTV